MTDDATKSGGGGQPAAPHPGVTEETEEHPPKRATHTTQAV